MLRSLLHIPIVPGNIYYNVIYHISSLCFRGGLLKANTKIHYVEVHDGVLVLTPLAGSSSIREEISNVKTWDLLDSRSFPSGKMYILDRPFADRMKSFYNKKVRNPTNTAKAVFLATCSPLSLHSSAAEFNDYLVEHHKSLHKDKHLYTTKQITDVFRAGATSIHYLDISKDLEVLEVLLKVDLNKRVRTTEDISTYQPPVDFLLDSRLMDVSDE